MRRTPTASVVLACALLTAPLDAGAQSGKVPRIGVIAGELPNKSGCVDALKRGLGGLGYVEGRTHVFEMRCVGAWCMGRVDLVHS